MPGFIQVFKSIHRFGKAEYGPEQRAAFSHWEPTLESKGPYWEAQKLYIAPSQVNTLKGLDLVIVQDHRKLSLDQAQEEEAPKVHFFQSLKSAQAFDIFR